MIPIKKILSFGLLVFVPISIAAKYLHWGDLTVFITSALTVIPLAIWLSKATEGNSGNHWTCRLKLIAICMKSAW